MYTGNQWIDAHVPEEQPLTLPGFAVGQAAPRLLPGTGTGTNIGKNLHPTVIAN